MTQKNSETKILITGAAGFIGSHLCARFLNQGKSVIGVDNFCTGQGSNVTRLQKQFGSKFEFFEADVIQPLPKVILDQPLSWIFHFASPASPPKYFSIPLETMRVNAEGTRHLLERCQQEVQGVTPQFFYASTSEVYGDPLEHPQKESYWGNVNPIGVRSIYDEAKRYGEALTYLYHREHQVKVRVIRIFNTYGPQMDPDDGRVVTNLLFQAIRGQALTIYGDGSQTRSFQYVDDLIEGIEKLTMVDYSLPVNLGNPNEFSILEFSKIVQEVCGRTIPIEYRPLPQDDPKQRRPDISLAKKILNWDPKVSLREGLKRTLTAFS